MDIIIVFYFIYVPLYRQTDVRNIIKDIKYKVLIEALKYISINQFTRSALSTCNDYVDCSHL